MNYFTYAIFGITGLLFYNQAIAGADKTIRDNKLKAQIEALKREYSIAELMSALGEKPEADSSFHGSLGSNIEVEHIEREDGVTEGKVKITLAQGNFRHDDLPGWDVGFYSGREELYSGPLTHADYNRGVNSINEIYANRAYNTDDGYYGWGVKLAQESLDKRTMPEVKIFGGYNISDNLTFNGYGLYQIQYKRNTGDFSYWEIEPGLAYKLSERSGIWLNFRYQEGLWSPKAGDQENETEWFIKPGVFYNWGELSASLWGEFGEFKKDNNTNGNKIWREKYAKYGLSTNLKLNRNWSLFGEFSYKNISFDNYGDNRRFGGYIPLLIMGVNYNF